jgi:hypothetical protein
MDRLHIYDSRTLLAVEFAQKPASFAGIADHAQVFVRLDLRETETLARKLIQASADHSFSEQVARLMDVLKERVGYWETRVPAGSKCFVHHVRFEDEARSKAGYAQAAKLFPQFAMIGLYAIDPSISFFPQAFPLDAAPNFWRPGHNNVLTEDSQFFFNFFPQQKYLREFVYQGTIAIYSESAPGIYDTNNYVDLLPDAFTSCGSVEPIVGVNLNRYRDAHGFFKAVAAGAAKSVIVEGHEQFQWHGMLTKLIQAA